ncbi:hypothetical protein KC887_00605 [Candidatus Kaiserbacteria bacterium]|nr:hypothetical protein [Candidatus Kaiserbacteria bacterium]
MNTAQVSKTARQIAREHTWTIYGISLATGLRDKLRFRWNLDDPEFEQGALELRVWQRRAKEYEPRNWWQYCEDFTLGCTLDGEWYLYAWYGQFDRDAGPVTYDVHIGDFPGFETAFCAMLLTMGSDLLDNITEIRHERKFNSQKAQKL